MPMFTVRCPRIHRESEIQNPSAQVAAQICLEAYNRTTRNPSGLPTGVYALFLTDQATGHEQVVHIELDRDIATELF